MGKITIPESEVEMSAVRSQGAGGQNVNKVATAIHLRFNIRASSLSDRSKRRLLKSRDKRITKAGIVVIKSQKHRTQEKNRKAAIARLEKFVEKETRSKKKRKPTKPTKASKQRRLDKKTRRGALKKNRKKVSPD